MTDVVFTANHLTDTSKTVYKIQLKKNKCQ